MRPLKSPCSAPLPAETYLSNKASVQITCLFKAHTFWPGHLILRLILTLPLSVFCYQVSTENNLKNIIYFTLKVQRIMHKPWPCSFGLTTGHIYVQKEWEAKRREKAIEFGLLVLDNGKWRGRKWAFGRSFHESQKDRKEIRLLLCTQPQLCRASPNQLAIGNVFLTLACNT